MEYILSADDRRRIVLDDITRAIRSSDIRKGLVRNIVGMAWNLAENQIKLVDGELELKDRVEELKDKLRKTSLGTSILSLSGDLAEAIKDNKEETRNGLIEYLRKNK